MRIRLLCACGVMAFICATATTRVAAAEPGTEALGAVATGEVFPIPENMQIQEHYYNPKTGEYRVGAMRSEDEPILVYSNTGGAHIYPPGNRQIADDVTTVAVGGCHVSGYEILVGISGSEGGGDPYTIEVGLWDACPGANPPGQLVPGTDALFENIPDDGQLHLLEVDLEGSEVPMESTFWLTVKFSGNSLAGWVTGSPADEGFTQDVFDFPHPALRCSARTGLGYSGFYAQIWCSPDPPFPREFLAYYNPNFDAPIYVPGPAQWMMDDATLIVDDCELSSLEVAVIGTTGTFNMQVELWGQWANPDMLIEGTHRTYTGRGDGTVELARFTFLDEENHGIPITETVWVAWRFNKSGVGPIISGYPVLSHGNEDIFGLWDVCADLNGPQCSGNNENCTTDADCPAGACNGDGDPCHTDEDCPAGQPCVGGETCDTVVTCCNEACFFWFGGNPYAGFNATIRCLGEAPRGACCDMSSATAAEGFCRDDSTEYGCSGPSRRWLRDGTCAEFDTFDPPCGYAACCLPPENPFLGSEGCIDLPQHDPPIPCTVDEDCPRLDCPEGGGFCETGLGLPIFCMGDEDCPNLDCEPGGGYCETGVGCADISDWDGNPAVWAPGKFCNIEPKKDCYLWACLFSDGPCDVPQDWPETGCNDPLCCDMVCSSGPFGAYCCEVNWDQGCADLAQDICDILPMNDDCINAIPVVFNDQCWNDPNILCADASNTRATLDPDDPGFCCHPAGAGRQGAGSLWYTFEAPAEKVKIDTCYSATGDDSLVEVYEVGDPSTPESACATLTPITCNDDGGCSGLGQSEQNSQMNVFHLITGNTYYIQLASKTSMAKGKYKLKISPTSASEPPDYSYCKWPLPAWLGSTPFDVEDTVMDCPIEPLLPAMQNNVWFDFTVFAGGLYVVTTCPESGPGPDTTLVVYGIEGLDPSEYCPVDPEWQVAINDDWGGDCGSGSRAFFSHPGGAKVFKIRVGGENGSEPSGMLTISMAADCNGNMIPDVCDISCGVAGGACDMSGCGQSTDGNGNDIPDDCEEDCPDDVTITFVNPPSGLFDARQPHPVYDPITLQGHRTFVVDAPDVCCSIDCWSSSETEDNPAMHPGLSSNYVWSADPSGENECTITLDRAIAHGEMTTITYTSLGGSTTIEGTFTFHPGDVNQDGTSTAADITALIGSLNGPPLADEQADIDRDGEQGPADLLRLLDLLNGAGDYEAWLDV